MKTDETDEMRSGGCIYLVFPYPRYPFKSAVKKIKDRLN